MKYSIQKGKHYCSPLVFDLYLEKFPSLFRRVIFNNNIPYNIDGASDTMEGDDFDVNKLIGFGFLNFKNIVPHHWDSVRVGWNWNQEHKCIDLYAYCYIEGKRIIQLMCSCETGLPVEIYIDCSQESYNIRIVNRYAINNKTSSFTIARPKIRSIAYLLGPYFGGNISSPHDMSLFMEQK